VTFDAAAHLRIARFERGDVGNLVPEALYQFFGVTRLAGADAARDQKESAAH
jgi:hypothetical protein